MIIIAIILSIAFLTLLERKVLGYVQRRTGPNIVGFYGIIQPIFDGVKLILKENIVSHSFLSHILPSIIVFFISLLLFLFLPYNINILPLDNHFSIVYIFAISTLAIYGILYGGYYSYSKYALIGSLRSVSQLVSYEISISLILIINIIMNNTFHTYWLSYSQLYISNWLPSFLNSVLLLISFLAETNRTPFDLLESESELVAGFLVEYSSISFVFYYLAEYAMILFWSVFMGIYYNYNFILILFLFILARASLPRFRYDQLMILGWLYILPLSILFDILYLTIFFVY